MPFDRFTVIKVYLEGNGKFIVMDRAADALPFLATSETLSREETAIVLRASGLPETTITLLFAQAEGEIA